jgi:hypothetical protein
LHWRKGVRLSGIYSLTSDSLIGLILKQMQTWTSGFYKKTRILKN